MSNESSRLNDINNTLRIILATLISIAASIALMDFILVRIAISLNKLTY